jgi:hypothetical protein
MTSIDEFRNSLFSVGWIVPPIFPGVPAGTAHENLCAEIKAPGKIG